MPKSQGSKFTTLLKPTTVLPAFSSPSPVLAFFHRAGSVDVAAGNPADSDSDDGQGERDKLLKQLAFPTVESTKFSPQDYPKVSKCIAKRVSKMNEMIERLNTVSSRSTVQNGFYPQILLSSSHHASSLDLVEPTVICKNDVYTSIVFFHSTPRLLEKAKTLANELNQLEESIMAKYTQGVVDGFKKGYIP